MNHARRYSRHSVALRCLLCVAVAPAILVGCFRPDVPRGCDAAEQVNEILHWLPLDTETVVVANGPFKFANPPEDPPFCFNEAVRSLAFSCLLNERIAPKELIGQRIVIAMEGSRRFRSPRGLGMMPFEGCQVVIFDEDATPALTIAMQSLSRRAARTVELSGKEVAVFEHKSEPRHVDHLHGTPWADNPALCHRPGLYEGSNTPNGEPPRGSGRWRPLFPSGSR